ncbi:DUF6348 family protein [Acaryochloris sp. IP29b_bin.137]|uniref:DUF6348 family protein n=1 Tax=Acaryochloris sp. IP29b_bin.137 TaxID=2969217 RepID=UPI00262E1F0F|nr:DUF6348 family protein [Acaryochloris sp. IP29b_bin.137]
MTTLADVLIRLFNAHDISCTVENDWVFPSGQLPAIRCLWHPPSAKGAGRLDVEVLLANGNTLIESFAGLGEGNHALMDGVQNFVLGSFHVLLASLYGKNDPEQVTTERWSIGGTDWKVFVGNFSRRASQAQNISVPKSAFTSIETAIFNTPLTSELHWFRTFYCQVGNQQIFEALINNEPWQQGEVALKSIPWPQVAGYSSVRNFLVLAKDVKTSP